jgi:hypothetical protein
VVTHGLPPNDGHRIAHAPHLVIDCVHINLVLQFDSRVAVPALHQVHQVQHDDKRDGDVDVSVVTWPTLIGLGLAVVGRVRLVQIVHHPRDDGQATPSNGGQAAENQQGQDQALPVSIASQGSAE